MTKTLDSLLQNPANAVGFRGTSLHTPTDRTMNARTLMKSLALLALLANIGMITRAVAQEAAAVPEAKKDEVGLAN